MTLVMVLARRFSLPEWTSPVRPPNRADRRAAPSARPHRLDRTWHQLRWWR